jgi:CBS domain-containing protein
MVDRVALEGVLAASGPAAGEPVGRHLTARDPILGEDDALDDALGTLADHRRDWAPVSRDGRLSGVLSVRDIMAAYRKALDGNVRRIRGLRTDGVIVEADVVAGTTLAGRRVADAPWPREAVLVAVERRGAVIVPRGDLVLAAGDRVSVFASTEAAAALRELLTTPAATRPDTGATADPGEADRV